MSDAQYRLLIQRSFDEELNKQEHRALIEHLESSESGAKFHHQLDQMIQAAQDTPLPDELRPQNPEALARMIMEQLPQKKGSVFGFLGNLFSGLSKGKSSAPAPQKEKLGKAPKGAPQKGKGKPAKVREEEEMQEQEDSGSTSRGPGMKFPRKGKELNADQIESQVGGFGRLKSIGNKAQELEDNRESQSTTRSLGEKFSMPWANQEGPNEGPLTLAESIKRKVTESQKLSPIDEDDMTGSQNDTGSSGFGRGPAPSTTGTEGWSAPISMPNQQAAQTDWAGGSGGGFGGASQPPNFAQQPGTSNSGMGSMPKPQAPQPFGQQPAAFNKPDIGLADKGERGSAIGLAPQAKAPEPVKPASSTGTDWGGGWSGGGSNTEQSGWGNQPQAAPAAAPAAQPEAPKADWGSGWATPSDQRQPLKSSDSWAMPGSEGAGAWGAANNGTNAEPEPQQAAPAPAPAPAAADPWGAPQAPAASMEGVGSMGSAGMGNMGSAGMAPSSSGVNMQAQQPAAPAWGQAPANDNAGWNQAANWGNEQVASAPVPQPAAPAPQPVAADPWAQAVPAQIPAPQAPQAPAQEPNMGGWGAQPAAGGWNQPPAQAPAPVAEVQQQQAADPWAQPIAQAAVAPVEPIAAQPQAAQGGWGMPATSPQEALQQQAAKAPAQKRSWATAEPDLIETGTFRAFTPTMDNALGAKSKPAAAPGGFGAQPAGLPQAGAAQDNRWDIPISERNKMPEAAQAAPAPVAPVQTAPADNRWDLPIQERVKMQQDGPQVVAAQAPQPISPVGMPGQPGGGIPVNQIVDKMDQVLAGGGVAQAQPSDDRWDVPIQERIKQGQEQPPMAPEPAPAQINNGWQAAPAPAPAPVPVSGWGEVAQPAQTNNSGWPQTAPAPVQQGAGWAQEAPAAPAPAPAPAPGGWGAAAPAPAPAPVAAWNQAPAPVPPAPQAHSEITDKAKGGGLFNINDSDIDNIFGGIGVKESVSQSVVNTGGGEAAPPAPAPAPAPAPGGWGAPQMTPEPTPGQSSFAPPGGFAQPAPAQANAVQANAANKGLFQLDDSQVDQIFNNIGVNEPSVPVGKTGEMAQPQAFAPPPQPAAAAPGGWGNAAPVAQAPAPSAWPQGNAQAPAAWPQAAAEPAAQSWPAASAAPVPAQPAGWSQVPAAPMPVPQAFAVDDKVMNRIFDEPQPAAGQSRDNMPVPKIEGIGRLDAGSDSSQDAGSGRIASIGKFLLDQKDLDKLGKLTNTDPAEGKMRILTLEASQDLQELLGQIGKLSGVVGSVIVGHDGLLIANTMPGDMDAESVGVWALGVYMNTQHVTSKMGHDKVHQVVSRTPRGYVVIADFGGGLLVTVTDGSETDLLIPLMRTITLLVN